MMPIFLFLKRRQLLVVVPENSKTVKDQLERRSMMMSQLHLSSSKISSHDNSKWMRSVSADALKSFLNWPPIKENESCFKVVWCWRASCSSSRVGWSGRSDETEWVRIECFSSSASASLLMIVVDWSDEDEGEPSASISLKR